MKLPSIDGEQLQLKILNGKKVIGTQDALTKLEEQLGNVEEEEEEPVKRAPRAPNKSAPKPPTKSAGITKNIPVPPPKPQKSGQTIPYDEIRKQIFRFQKWLKSLGETLKLVDNDRNTIVANFSNIESVPDSEIKKWLDADLIFNDSNNNRLYRVREYKQIQERMDKELSKIKSSPTPKPPIIPTKSVPPKPASPKPLTKKTPSRIIKLSATGKEEEYVPVRPVSPKHSDVAWKDKLPPASPRIKRRVSQPPPKAKTPPPPEEEEEEIEIELESEPEVEIDEEATQPLEPIVKTISKVIELKPGAQVHYDFFTKELEEQGSYPELSKQKI